MTPHARLEIAVQAAAKRLRLGVDGPKCADELEAALVAIPSEPVAWQTRYSASDPWVECRRDWYEIVKKERPQDARALAVVG